MNQQLLCSLIEEKQHESFNNFPIWIEMCDIAAIQNCWLEFVWWCSNRCVFVDLCSRDFWILITFFVFTLLTSCCFQIVVKPLSLLPTYVGGNESNSAWLLSCVQTGGDLPRARMIPISWFDYLYSAVCCETSGRLLKPLLWFHFSLVLYFPPCNSSSYTLNIELW
jgi:hypothetical protein